MVWAGFTTLFCESERSSRFVDPRELLQTLLRAFLNCVSALELTCRERRNDLIGLFLWRNGAILFLHQALLWATFMKSSSSYNSLRVISSLQSIS